MSTTTNLGITYLEPGLRQPEVRVNDAFNILDAAFGGNWYNVKAQGLVGDGLADDTAALQALIDLIASTGQGGTIFFPAGVYKIAGALQDTSFSNSQIVLPKVNSPNSMICIRLLGETPPAFAWDTDAGVILLSTLTSGTGQMIGVKNNISGITAPPASPLHVNTSWISLVIENITFRMQADPTNSALDLTYIPHCAIRNVRVDTTGLAINLIGGGSPDMNIPLPTHSTSYGIKGNIQIVNVAIYDNVEILGYYNGTRWSELVNADNITICGSVYGLEMAAGIHRNDIGRILFVSNQNCIRVTGATLLNIRALDIEHDAQPLTVADIVDASNLLTGEINWFSEVPISTGTFTGQVFGVSGAANVVFRRLNRPWHECAPFVETSVGGSMDTANHAVDQTYRGLATSDNTKVAWKTLVTQQSGTANVVGILAALNAAITTAAADRRIAQIAMLTDGAINSGSMLLSVLNAGTLTDYIGLDHLGNLTIVKLLESVEGASLTISSNTIAPTNMVHVVGAGLIKTITLPTGWTGGTITLLAGATPFTMDTTGNIAFATNPAAQEPVRCTYAASTGKWHCK